MAEEMKEGTSFFTVSALLPVAESFGFADGRNLLEGEKDWFIADTWFQILESELRGLRVPS